MSDPDTPTTAEYRRQSLQLQQQTHDAVLALGKDVKDTRERVIGLEAANYAGQIAGLKADIRMLEQKLQQQIDSQGVKVRTVETDNARQEEKIAGLRAVTIWISGIAATVIAAAIVALVIVERV